MAKGINMTGFSLRKKVAKKNHAQLIIQPAVLWLLPSTLYTNESVHNRWYYQNYFSLITLVPCTVIYSLKILNF